jgi:hypothetical protein
MSCLGHEVKPVTDKLLLKEENSDILKSPINSLVPVRGKIKGFKLKGSQKENQETAMELKDEERWIKFYRF